MSNTAWFIYAVVGALVSLVGLSAAVALRDRWIAVVAAVALVAFASGAVLFGRAVF
jgi:sulfite exporter TauE/SafE